MAFSKTSHQVITPQGGLELQKSVLEMGAGQLLDCHNFELAYPKGWRRVDGNEPFDGRLSPHRVRPQIFTATHSNNLSAGTHVTVDGTRDAILVYDYSPTSDLTLIAADSYDELPLGAVVDGVTPICTTTIETYTEDMDDYATLKADATAIAIAEITEVPGDPAVPPYACWSYRGNLYAFRKDTGATSMSVYKSTINGWVKIDMLYTVTFDTGNTVVDIPIDGCIMRKVAGGADPVTAYNINKTNDAVDSWATGAAAGTITMSDAASYPYSIGDTVEFVQDSVVQATATITSDATQIVLLPGVAFEFENYRFLRDSQGISGDLTEMRMYGVDGANPAFQIDENDRLVQIVSNAPVDIPTHVYANQFQLFLSVDDSWHVSPVGTPFGKWEGVGGADRFGVGDDIIGAVVSPGGVAISFSRNSINMVYPPQTATDYYTIKQFSQNYGAIEWSIQSATVPVFLSDAGLSAVTTSDAFGDFNTSTIDEPIKELIVSLKDSFVTSCTFRNKSEVRYFFEDNTYIRGKFDARGLVGYTMGAYNVPVTFVSESVRSDRYITNGTVEKDHVFFCSDDGYIRQMDVGRYFDGVDIQAYLELPWNHMGLPRVKKRWYDVIFEIEAEDTGVSIGVRPNYNMYAPTRPQVLQTDIDINASMARWSEVNWSEFYWASAVGSGMYKVRLRGVTPGLSFAIASTGGPSFTVRSMVVRFAGRGEVR